LLEAYESDESVFDGEGDGLLLGTRMFVPQDLHRTVLPRAKSGIDKTFRHVRLGHMILTIF